MMITEKQISDQRLVARNGGTLAGIYLHIPFCRTKCSYCDFNCYAGQSDLIPEYVEALCNEIEEYGSRGWKARTLYFGGGTPSLLSPEQVGELITTARKRLDLGETEITLEANPGTVDERYFRALLDAGVNRLSLGVQSFRDSDLRPLARHHTAQEAIEAFKAARRAGVDNISIDLIYGLPGQTLEAWEDNLREAIKLQPDHLSLYALSIEEGTPLERQVRRGRVRPVDDDLMADMYESAQRELTSAGYYRYEISSWARTDRESRHNLVYWRNQPFVGAGAGAHGFLNSMRYSNERLPARYIERVRERGLSVVCDETISPELERAETLILALRLEDGIRDSEFKARYGCDIKSIYGQALEFTTNAGLTEWRGERLLLTERGKLLSNEVFQLLLPD